jgi:uncharacterized protein YqgC (DUF456 family)
MEIITFAFVLFLVLFTMMVGLIFTIIPPLPGTLIIWIAALGYALVRGWPALGWWTFGIMTFLMIVGLVVDFLGGQFGARLGGASCLAMIIGSLAGFILGIIGSIFGTPIIGCLVGIVGTVGGILLVEKIRYRDWKSALNAIKGFAAGTTAGIMARFTSGVLMIVVFMVRVYVGGY